TGGCGRRASRRERPIGCGGARASGGQCLPPTRRPRAGRSPARRLRPVDRRVAAPAARGGPTMIGAKGLAKRFRNREALHSISFEVEEGEIYGLLGRNGAGKTTTVRILACLLRPSGGEGRVAGFDIRTDAPSIRACIGILTEVPGLYERLSAWEYLDFFGDVYGLSRPERHSRAEELLRMLGIWEVRDLRLRGY